MDWHDAVQCFLHHTSSPLHAAGASAAQCACLGSEMGSGRAKCGGGLPVCEWQLHLLGSCRQNVQTFPAAARAHPLWWPLELSVLLAGALQLLNHAQPIYQLSSSSCQYFHAIGCNHMGFLDYLAGICLWVQGSVGFLSGSLLTQSLLVFAPTILIDEWFGMFAGYFLGSLCFLSGSFLTIVAPTS